MSCSWHFEPKARRIVARVDQLMSLCDKLEAGLARSQADSERSMEAVLSRVLEVKSQNEKIK